MVPPPAPEPTMTTTFASLSSKRGMSPGALRERHRAAIDQRHVGKPLQIIEAAQQVATLGERFALITKMRPGDRVVIEHHQSLYSRRLEEGAGFDRLEAQHPSFLATFGVGCATESEGAQVVRLKPIPSAAF